MIYLTDEQRQALRQSGAGTPLPVYDPQTDQVYVLLPSALYERVRAHLKEATPGEDLEIQPGIRRSKEAFWRALPELLRDRRHRGKWVAYHGEQCIAIHRDKVEVIRALKHQAIPGNQYYIDLIQEHEPEPVEIEPSSAGFDGGEVEAIVPTSPNHEGKSMNP
jgi:hypothetical protein